MIAFAPLDNEKKIPGAKEKKPDPAILKLQELQMEMHQKWAVQESVALEKGKNVFTAIQLQRLPFSVDLKKTKALASGLPEVTEGEDSKEPKSAKKGKGKKGKGKGKGKKAGGKGKKKKKK
jgi:hypothetical protein